ncbi:YicC family protein [Bacteroidetes bacterium endosymbiont of Geopemphigus sp.]|uniref:YicC family protein n=1 Tax=Bacteroidetes bacterium endosymbiont of Geopemphigus sp. TaxID=2047937 RepID=UPI000CD08242|nr:DUF1732 domain-containing protein [Bacteroidetes bacterium endosymbiont of Geopemphigus sp.]
MTESMTGFSRMEKELFDKKVTIEIRTLNSKYLDMSFRLPAIYHDKEWTLRKKTSEFLIRGKIEISLHLQSIRSSQRYSLDADLIRSYMQIIKTIVPGFKEIRYFSLAMKMPDALIASAEAPDEKEWLSIESLFQDTLISVGEVRKEEGKFLSNDFTHRVQNILQLLDQIIPFEKERKALIREKIEKQFNNQNISADPIRLEQELLLYLEKIDITEERIRLRKHCEYFAQVVTQEKSQGRKLGFIAQEISREINTLGVKSQHIEIHKSVVLMKEELEKIREQLVNIL